MATPEVQEGGMARFVAMSRKKSTRSACAISGEKKVGRPSVAENAIFATFQDTEVIVGAFN
jgi:hypothetical protein